MEALGAAATVAQLVSFSGEVLLKGYSFLSKVQKGPAEIRSMLRETANLNALLDQLQSLSTEPSTGVLGAEKEEMRTALQTLETLGVFEDCDRLMQVVEQSLKACEQVQGHEVRNFGKRLVWPFREQETKDTMVQLGRLRETLSAAVVVDSAKTLREVENLAKEIDKAVIASLDGIAEVQMRTEKTSEDIGYVKNVLNSKMEEEERLSIRRWLHPDGINVEASFTTAFAARLSDTGQWLVGSEEFVAWKETVHGCMWVYGIAGCGKTVLSATVVNHLQQTSTSESACVIYFFCDHRNSNMQSIQDLLHVIVKQLLDRNQACFEVAKYWYDERLRTVAGPQSTAAKPLSQSEYVNLICQMCLKWESVSLVIDALDECKGLHSFVGALKDILGDSNVRLLLTSRHDVNIKRVMEPIADFQISMMEKMGEDIEKYLWAEVQRRIASGTFKFKQKGLDALVVYALLGKADGMILIAKLQLDYIFGLRSDRAIKEALVKLPSGICATYDEILHQLCTKNPDDVEDMKRILRWLVFSMESLTLQQLAEIVSIRPDDRTLDESGIATDLMELAACCGSLVTVHNQSTSSGQYEDLRGPQVTLITLAHASVEEYLTSGKIGNGLSSIFHMDAKAVHHELGKTCLQYIGFEDFASPMKQPKGLFHDGQVVRNSIQILRSRLIRRTSKYAMIDYACLQWPAHLRQSNFMESADEETVRLLDWFMHSDDYPGNYVSWQQMYHHDVTWYCCNRPAYFYAIEFKIESLVKLLLPSDVDIDQMPNGDWSQTPLHVAARCGSLNIVQDFIRRGASIELKSGPAARSMTAMHFAAEGGHTEVVKFLLESGASPHSRSNSQSTPFYRAARSGSLKALRVLYDAGSDINALTWDNFTPLFEAVAHGRARTAAQLLKWGADPTIVNGTGQSTLKLLARDKNFEAEQRGYPFVTENDILNDIKSIQAANGDFAYYLKDLKPQYVLVMRIELDSRPGIERDKDYRWSRDPSKIVPMSEYQDKDD